MEPGDVSTAGENRLFQFTREVPRDPDGWRDRSTAFPGEMRRDPDGWNESSVPFPREMLWDSADWVDRSVAFPGEMRRDPDDWGDSSTPFPGEMPHDLGDRSDCSTPFPREKGAVAVRVVVAVRPPGKCLASPVSAAIDGPMADPSARHPRGPGRGRGVAWRSVGPSRGLHVGVNIFPCAAARFSTSAFPNTPSSALPADRRGRARPDRLGDDRRFSRRIRSGPRPPASLPWA